MIYGHFCCCRSLKLESPLQRLPLRQFLMLFSTHFLQNTFKRPSPDPFAGSESPKASAAKKGRAAAKKGGKKKKDPNEPQK